MIIKNTKENIAKLNENNIKYFSSQDEKNLFIPELKDERLFAAEELEQISSKFKLVSKKFQETRDITFLDGTKLDLDEITLIAGPCSIGNEEDIYKVAEKLKNMGIKFFRAGAYKPRTSPHDLQGHEQKGLEVLKNVKERFGLKIVSEIMDASDIEKFEGIVDIMQVGARNMQNFTLLKALGKTKTPVLLKRGLAATMEEFVLCAEYIVAHGNHNVILCERGIRTFETHTRNTFDVSVVPFVKEYTNLPIILDPSHGVGKREYVKAMSLSSVAAGCDGLILEADIDPLKTNTDIDQTISLETLKEIEDDLVKLAPIVNKRYGNN